jgi:two-component system, response regulator PdtaR
MKVLIVEDEAIIAMYLELLVEKFGHQVCAIASSAAEAIAHAAAHRPDVALMDIRLANGSSGLDAAREIYARHHIRCIFLSGNLDGATRAAVSACQPIDFVGKPILPSLLQRALEKVSAASSG